MLSNLPLVMLGNRNAQTMSGGFNVALSTAAERCAWKPVELPHMGRRLDRRQNKESADGRTIVFLERFEIPLRRGAVPRWISGTLLAPEANGRKACR